MWNSNWQRTRATITKPKQAKQNKIEQNNNRHFAQPKWAREQLNGALLRCCALVNSYTTASCSDRSEDARAESEIPGSLMRLSLKQLTTHCRFGELTLFLHFYDAFVIIPSVHVLRQVGIDAMARGRSAHKLHIGLDLANEENLILQHAWQKAETAERGTGRCTL